MNTDFSVQFVIYSDTSLWSLSSLSFSQDLNPFYYLFSALSFFSESFLHFFCTFLYLFSVLFRYFFYTCSTSFLNFYCTSFTLFLHSLAPFRHFFRIFFCTFSIPHFSHTFPTLISHFFCTFLHLFSSFPQHFIS